MCAICIDMHIHNGTEPAKAGPGWQVQGGRSRVAGPGWQIQGGRSRVTGSGWQVQGGRSRVADPGWQVQGDKSMVVCIRRHVMTWCEVFFINC